MNSIKLKNRENLFNMKWISRTKKKTEKKNSSVILYWLIDLFLNFEC